jgi:hypothetical protein
MPAATADAVAIAATISAMAPLVPSPIVRSHRGVGDWAELRGELIGRIDFVSAALTD